MRRKQMRPLCLAAAVLGVVSSTAMAADNWVKLATLADNAGTLYLDKDSIEDRKSVV